MSCNHSLFLAHHLLIWEAGHCKGYVKSKQDCQVFLSPTFVLANLHPLKNMREVSLSTAEHHVRASGANTNRLPKRQEEKTFGVH